MASPFLTMLEAYAAVEAHSRRLGPRKKLNAAAIREQQRHVAEIDRLIPALMKVKSEMEALQVEVEMEMARWHETLGGAQPELAVIRQVVINKEDWTYQEELGPSDTDAPRAVVSPTWVTEIIERDLRERNASE